MTPSSPSYLSGLKLCLGGCVEHNHGSINHLKAEIYSSADSKHLQLHGCIINQHLHGRLSIMKHQYPLHYNVLNDVRCKCIRCQFSPRSNDTHTARGVTSALGTNDQGVIHGSKGIIHTSDTIPLTYMPSYFLHYILRVRVMAYHLHKIY